MIPDTADVDTLAAHVARAWSGSSLPQTQFGAALRQLAAGYANAPEAEAESAPGTVQVVLCRGCDTIHRGGRAHAGASCHLCGAALERFERIRGAGQ